MKKQRLGRAIPLFVCGLIFSSQSDGQSMSDTLYYAVDEAVEAALEYGTRDVEDSQLADELMQISMTPIDLNSASEAELQQIPGVDATLAARVTAFAHEHGFNSVSDLLLVDGVDHILFMQIKGFLIVTKNNPIPDIREGFSVHYTGRTIRRLQNQRGFLDGSYSGNPYKVYNRINSHYVLDSRFAIEAGSLMEKDPGEKNIADFSSGYISIVSPDKSLKCIIGDYVIEAGQGLAMWRSAGTTKGSEVISSVAKNPRGLQPYASSDENGFLRGVAVQTRLSVVEMTLYLSRKPVNAKLNDQGFISSFDVAGLFRTESEVRSKASSMERMAGANCNVQLSNSFRMGLSAYTTNFEHPVALSTVNGFHGQVASIQSIDGSYSTGTVGLFGEAAVDRAKSVAEIGGIVVEPVPKLEVALVAHSYPERFVSLHGFGFGESGDKVQNEKGLYASVKIAPLDWLVVSTYYDQFSTLGASTLSLLPTNGNELFNIIQFQCGGNSLLEFQLKQKLQADQESVMDEFARSNAVVGNRIQSNFRGSFEWNPTPSFRWRVRLERVTVKYSLAGTPAAGFLFYQDLRVKPRPHLNVDGRVIVFETDSYDSRIYEYESELHGTFVNPALYGKGIRMYVLTRYELGAVEISMKYSATIKPGLKSTGTGTNEIEGDTDNQLSMQLDITI